MAVQRQFRRGTKEQNDGFVGAPGEITVDTDQWLMRIHDGVTPGGHALQVGAAGADAPLAITVADLAASRSLTLADLDGLLRSTSATAITLTIPTDAAVAWPIGRAVAVVQSGAGQVTVAAAGGVTLSGVGTKLRAVGALLTLVKTGANRWLLTGDVS